MTLAIIALILGILSILTGLVPFLGVVLAVVGIILGVVGRKKIVESGDGKTGIATAAIIVSAIGAALALPMTLCSLLCGSSVGCAACAELAEAGMSAILYLF